MGTEFDTRLKKEYCARRQNKENAIGAIFENITNMTKLEQVKTFNRLVLSFSKRENVSREPMGTHGIPWCPMGVRGALHGKSHGPSRYK